MKLREDFIELENIDPLRYITIASVCMLIFRGNYMPNETIAIMPEYNKPNKFSKISIMWLEYLSNGSKIKHALKKGEKKLVIGNMTYYVDGWILRKNEYSVRILRLLLAWLPKVFQTKYCKQFEPKRHGHTK